MLRKCLGLGFSLIVALSVTGCTMDHRTLISAAAPYRLLALEQNGRLCGFVVPGLGPSRILDGKGWTIKDDHVMFTLVEGVVMAEEQGLVCGGNIRLGTEASCVTISQNYFNYVNAYHLDEKRAVSFGNIDPDNLKQARELFDQSLRSLPPTLIKLRSDPGGNLILANLDAEDLAKLPDTQAYAVNCVFYDGRRFGQNIGSGLFARYGDMFVFRSGETLRVAAFSRTWLLTYNGTGLGQVRVGTDSFMCGEGVRCERMEGALP